MFEFIANNYLLVAVICFTVYIISTTIVMCDIEFGAVAAMIIFAAIPYVNIVVAILTTIAAVRTLVWSIKGAFNTEQRQ